MNVPAWARRAAFVPFFALAAVLATWPILASPGHPYNVDISGFFPLTPDAYEGRFWPTWNERGGMSTLQFLPALLIELPILLLGSALAWGMDVHIKLRVVLGFTLAGASMFALARYYLEKHYGDAGRVGARTIALVALAPALFYAFNPWSVHRVFHYFLWLGYALAPLLILCFERLADRPDWRRALLLALVFALATSDPHNPPYLALLLIPLGCVRLIQAAAASKHDARRLVGCVALASIAYVLLGAFWILPYAFNVLTNPGFGPTYVMSEQMLSVLSRGGDPASVARLLHNYLPRAPLWPEAGTARAVWEVASYAMPLLALNALLLAGRATTWTYGLIALASAALGMGDTEPFTQAYRWLLFHAPWGEGLSWLFRDPYRWGAFQALATAVLAAFALTEIVQLASKAPRAVRFAARPLAPLGAIACVLLFVAPALGGYVETVYAPVEVPSEYADANAFLAQTPDETQAVWMPRMLGATTWGGTRTFAYFDTTSSARGALGPFRPHTSRYFDLIGDATQAGGDVPRLLARAGVDYVMFHNDRDPARDADAVHKLSQTGLTSVATFGRTRVEAIDQASASAPDTPATRYAVHGERALSQTFVPSAQETTSLLIKAKRVGTPGPLNVTLHDAEGTLLATHQLALEPKATEARIPVAPGRVGPGAAYEFRAAVANSSGDANNRYDVSYYKVDAYAPGRLAVTSDGNTWRELQGDAYFELTGARRGFLTALRNPLPSPRAYAASTTLLSPEGLALLETLHALPPNATLRDAPVLFTHATPANRDALAKDDARAWHWVADLRASAWEPVIPFLPASAFVAPFEATVNADGKSGWARGTPEFVYDQWGWRHALRALKQKSWDFDLSQGLVYTSDRASLQVPLPDEGAGRARVVLARVYAHPGGGPLAVHANDQFVGRIDTRADPAGFRWVEIGEVPPDARHLTLTNERGFQGINVLAAVERADLDAARARSAQRFATLPVTLVAQERDLTNVTFHAAAPGRYVVWTQAATTGAPRNASLDGHPATPLGCRHACDDAGAWHAFELPFVDAGPHTLRLQAPPGGERPARVDRLVLSNAPDTLTGLGDTMRVPLTLERTSPTEYRVRVNATGPFHLVLTDPYDSGWRAHVDGMGAPLAPLMTDGVTNGFLVPADGPVTVMITYAPQAWARAGAWVSALALALVAMALGYAATRPPRPGEAATTREVVP